MSSCFSGGRAYKLNPIDLEMIKSPSSTTSWISNSSSPSSTLSESSNCPLPLISTRKPRTPRKRPNQTYNEAAAILSTAYPKIFPTNKQPCKFTKSLLEKKNKNNNDNNTNNNNNPFIPFDPSDLLVPFQAIDNSSGFLLHNQRSSFEPKGRNYLFEKMTCQSPSEINSELVCGDDQLGELDFDAESIILDEEIGEGIDCIMGDLGMENETSVEDIRTYNNNNDNSNNAMQVSNNFCYGYPVGLGFEFGQFGMKMERMAMRNNGDEGDWWRFPSVNVLDLTPRAAKYETKKKKKKKMVELKNLEMKKEDLGVKGVCISEEIVVPQKNEGLLLKLNFDGVLDAWSDKASPFSGDSTGPELAGNDVQARLAQIDLFSDNGGIREASVLRYKEKRRNRLFSKKIRYQVRKLNADRRPRMKGRFVRKSSSSDD